MTPDGNGGRPPVVLPMGGGPAGPVGRGGHRSGPGFLTVAAAAVMTVVGVVLFIAVVLVVLMVAVVAMVTALVVVGVHRLLHAVSPSYRQRRQVRGPIRPTATVIETTARLIDTAKPKRQ